MDSISSYLRYAVLFYLILHLCRTIQSDQIENYDDHLTLGRDDCADFCKRTVSCSGFAHDPQTQECYPSIDPLLGKPNDGLFLDKYSKDYETCNKMFTINTPMKTPAYNLKRPNATFQCRTGSDAAPAFWYHNHGVLHQLPAEDETVADPEILKKLSVTEFQDYNVKTHRWPTEETLLLDELERRQDQYYQETANLGKLPQHSRMPEPIESVAENRVQTLANGVTLTDSQIISKQQIVFGVDQRFIPGAYLNQEQCQTGVSLQDCLKRCQDEDRCQAVEWNPTFMDAKVTCGGKVSYDLYPEVCCLKTNQSDLRERPAAYRHGKSYLKNSRGQSGISIRINQ